jgi:predicted hydrolase (HD superfamily)
MENAIMSHNPTCGKNPETTLEYAIIAADPMSGFVKAVAQIYPDKKVASVKHKSVNKRFKEARFAAGANRQFMMEIEKTGITWDEFIDISLEAMKGVADEIGL